MPAQLHIPQVGRHKYELTLLKSIAGIFVVLIWSNILNNWPESYDRKLNQNQDLFWSCVFIMILVALFTIRPVKKPGILNREQTDEWKGWMQIIFLLYRYYRGTWIYNEIRVFVSVYVWMTGFGNFIYFTKKKDFSLKRVVSTLIRINLLTLGLMLFNGTSMMLYYVRSTFTYWILSNVMDCMLVHRKNEKTRFDSVVHFGSVSFVFRSMAAIVGRNGISIWIRQV